MKDDLISRQAVIDTLNVGTELLKRALDNTDFVGAERAEYEWGLGLIESCISDVKELPFVQSERKKGKWIWHPEQKNIFGGKCVECSVCGEKYIVQYIKDEKFCRNCGAEMNGEQDE